MIKPKKEEGIEITPAFSIHYSTNSLAVDVSGSDSAWVERWAYTLLHCADSSRFPSAESPKLD